MNEAGDPSALSAGLAGCTRGLAQPSDSHRQAPWLTQACNRPSLCLPPPPPPGQVLAFLTGRLYRLALELNVPGCNPEALDWPLLPGGGGALSPLPSQQVQERWELCGVALRVWRRWVTLQHRSSLTRYIVGSLFTGGSDMNLSGFWRIGQLQIHAHA